jgi:hypothetical protein
MSNDSFSDGEVDDAFPVATAVMVDPESLAVIANNAPGRRAAAGPPSVATTELASAVGSVVGPPRDAFLKSLTFFRETELIQTMGWGIRFSNNMVPRGSRNKPKLLIDSVQGIVALSKFKEGDYLKSINGKRVGPSFNAERALERMNQCLDNEGLLSVAVANKDEGDDILVQATVIKPRPNMTLEQMGMVVWVWGYLCIKSIDKDSIFKQSVLKSNDNIISVNDIVCDDLKPEQFAQIIEGLPHEITITVLRRKERVTGKFG